MHHPEPMTITSQHNPALKQLRRLARKHDRERSGRFVAEGEDLIVAAKEAGRHALEGYRVAGSGLGGDDFVDVQERALTAVSTLGSGTRVIGVYEQHWATAPSGPLCVYLHGVGDPGNVGTVLRSVDELRALVRGDPFDGAVETEAQKLYVMLFAEDLPAGLTLKGIEGDYAVPRVDPREDPARRKESRVHHPNYPLHAADDTPTDSTGAGAQRAHRPWREISRKPVRGTGIASARRRPDPATPGRCSPASAPGRSRS